MSKNKSTRYVHHIPLQLFTQSRFEIFAGASPLQTEVSSSPTQVCLSKEK